MEHKETLVACLNEQHIVKKVQPYTWSQNDGECNQIQSKLLIISTIKHYCKASYNIWSYIQNKKQ